MSWPESCRARAWRFGVATVASVTLKFHPSIPTNPVASRNELPSRGMRNERLTSGCVDTGESGRTPSGRDRTEDSRQSNGEKCDECSHHDGDGTESDLLLPCSLLLPRLESAAALKDPRRCPARRSVDEEFPGVEPGLLRDEGRDTIDKLGPSSVFAGRGVDERCRSDESVGSSECFSSGQGPRWLERLLREWMRSLFPYGPSYGATNGVAPPRSFRRGKGASPRRRLTCWLTRGLRGRVRSVVAEKRGRFDGVLSRVGRCVFSGRKRHRWVRCGS